MYKLNYKREQWHHRQHQKTTQSIVLDEEGKPLSKKALKKLEKEREKEKRKQERAQQLAAEKAEKEAFAVDVSREFYGVKPLNQSETRTNEKRVEITSIDASCLGETLILRARVLLSRPTGAKLCFFTLRQNKSTIQGVVSVDNVTISKQMLKFASNIPPESIVLVHGEVVSPVEPVKSCTCPDVELKITQLFVLAETKERLPFSLEDASRPEEDFNNVEAQYVRVNLDTRLNHRIIDLRTITNQAIFRIQSGVCRFFRDYLHSKSFIEIHTPKIISTASEGGANVFKINYFKTSAFLAQSPQLYKQMCVCSDFERVFEIGPVFRAEDSNTHRHMTEFVGLDLEMAFEEHYHEVLDVLDELFVNIFTRLQQELKEEIEIVNRQYPFEDFLFLPKTLRIKFPDAIAMLRAHGVEVNDFEDLNTENERTLGKLVRDKYQTDFYILDKFPLAARPFYTMPDPHDSNYSNSYDFFMRGEEILSGAQRIHDPDLLVQRAKSFGIDIASIQPYVDAFKYGAPPHAGGGIGMERVIMLYLNLGNIRRTSMFPRDPKRLEP